MERVRLDVVLNIEEHYAEVRPGIPEGPPEAASPALLGTRARRFDRIQRVEEHAAAAHAPEPIRGSAFGLLAGVQAFAADVLETGLRQSQLLGVRWSDLDLD